jgi:uncharacterized protein with HEPN domain
MPTNSRDAAALWDMVQAIQEIQEDVAGLSYEDFLENRTVRRAVERNFEILGEAARRVSASFQKEQADPLVGMTCPCHPVREATPEE